MNDKLGTIEEVYGKDFGVKDATELRKMLESKGYHGLIKFLLDDQ